MQGGGGGGFPLLFFLSLAFWGMSRMCVAPAAPVLCVISRQVALHLFEPRYKILIRRAMEGKRLFLYGEGVPKAGASAVVVRVVHAQILPDGCADIVGVGVERVHMARVWVEDGTQGLYYGHCDPTKVGTAAPPEPSDTVLPLPGPNQLPVFFHGSGVSVGRPVALRFFEARYVLMMERIMRQSDAGARRFIYAPARAEDGMHAVVVQVSRACATGSVWSVQGKAVQGGRLRAVVTVEGTHGLHYATFEPDSRSSEPRLTRRASSFLRRSRSTGCAIS